MGVGPYRLRRRLMSRPDGGEIEHCRADPPKVEPSTVVTKAPLKGPG